jgi:hypothetical protein
MLSLGYMHRNNQAGSRALGFYNLPQRNDVTRENRKDTTIV